MIPTAAYIHVPFCASRCSYCDFYSLRPRAEAFQRYTQAVCLEIRAEAAATVQQNGTTAPLKSCYFGGGTPSFLPLSALEEIMDTLRRSFSFDAEAEITLEANPAKNLPARLPALRQMGFNRLSLGLQSADNRLLQRLGRIHSREDFAESLRAAREAGFDNISSDLIFALPGQSLESFAEEVEWLLKFPLEHLSFYSLQLEEGTPLAAEMARDPSELPGEDEERAMYHSLRRRLSQSGLFPYEISNAARPGFVSRHNLVYWNALPYYAFGPAAASYTAGVRRHNPEDFELWEQKVLAAGETQAHAAAIEDEKIDRASEQAEYVMLRFRLTEGLSFKAYRERFGEEPQLHFADAFSRLQERGLLQKTLEGLALSELGLDLANQVMLEFV